MSAQRRIAEVNQDSQRNFAVQSQDDAGEEVWNQIRQHADKNFAEAKLLFETADSMHRKTESAKKQNDAAKLQYLRRLNAMTRYLSIIFLSESKLNIF
jgi:hypothetical protein